MDERPTHLDLFSGIGGFALAARWAGFRTIGFCEIDKYCQKVLAKNFLADTLGKPDEGILSSGGGKVGVGLEQDSLPQTRRQQSTDRPCSIHSNIFDFDGSAYQGTALLTGGFPCQPFSVAGKRRGSEDDRHLWPEMLRVITEARPAWVLGENVPGIIPMELDNVLSSLEGIGYATRPFVIPACAVDARHRRDRLWIVCHRNCGIESDLPVNAKVAELCGDRVSNTSGAGLEGQREIARRTGTQLNNTGDYYWWLPEPDVGRVAHGIPSRVDRLRGLGNAIVPQVAFEILREIRKLIC